MENKYFIGDKAFYKNVNSNIIVDGEIRDIRLNQSLELVYQVMSNGRIWDLKSEDIITSVQVYRDQR